MSSVKQRYCDISPVTLQVVGGAVSSSLYCGEVQGLSGEAGGLVESFLVELYRCKLCQFTCGLKTSISSHLLLRHRPAALTYLEEVDEGAGAEGGEEVGLQRGVSPYRLDLNGESKQSDEDEEFLLYNMLDNMSPPTCDISSEGGLQVAHTCEVSTLFEEEDDSSIFPLKGSPVDLSCSIDPPATQEEMAQSAHLMTLGLCRISAARPPPPPPPALPPHSSSCPAQHPPPPEDSPRLPQATSLKQSGTDGRQTRTPPSGRRRLPCFLCPVTLPSCRLLDVHVRSHRAGGGFSCIRCSWTADSWEELEPHWKSHCKRRRRRRRRREEEEKKKKAVASRNVHQQTHQHGSCSDTWRGLPIAQAGGKEAEHTDSQTSRPQTGSLQSVTGKKKKKEKKYTRRKKEEEEAEKEAEQKSSEMRAQTGFCCSLCHRKFSSKLTLRRHLGVHGGDKPFTCPHCSYSSRLKASLLQHLRTHTGEKPYRCAECPYASIDRSSLLRHCRTHSQEKPYRCQHCDYSSFLSLKRCWLSLSSQLWIRPSERTGTRNTKQRRTRCLGQKEVQTLKQEDLAFRQREEETFREEEDQTCTEEDLDINVFQSPMALSEIMRLNGFCLANTETILFDLTLPIQDITQSDDSTGRRDNGQAGEAVELETQIGSAPLPFPHHLTSHLLLTWTQETDILD